MTNYLLKNLKINSKVKYLIVPKIYKISFIFDSIGL